MEEKYKNIFQLAFKNGIKSPKSSCNQSESAERSVWLLYALTLIGMTFFYSL